MEEGSDGDRHEGAHRDGLEMGVGERNGARMEKGMGGGWRRKRDGAGLGVRVGLEEEVERDTETEIGAWKWSGKSKLKGGSRLRAQGAAVCGSESAEHSQGKGREDARKRATATRGVKRPKAAKDSRRRLLANRLHSGPAGGRQRARGSVTLSQDMATEGRFDGDGGKPGPPH